jgi:trimeric autotransporter adhesin
MFGPGGFGSTLFSNKLSRSQPLGGRDVKQIAAELAQRARTAVAARKHSTSLARKSSRRGTTGARRVRLASSNAFYSDSELQEEEQYGSDGSDESDIDDAPQGDDTWRTSDRFAAAVATASTTATATAGAVSGSTANGSSSGTGHTATAASYTAGAIDAAAVVKRAASTAIDSSDTSTATTAAVTASKSMHTDGAVAQLSWQAHDYHSAAAAALRSLSANVRDPPVLSLLRAATSELAAYPRRSDFAATVQLQLGCTVSTTTTATSTRAAADSDGGGVLGEGKHRLLVL